VKLLFLDGEYLLRGAHPPVFCPVAGPERDLLLLVRLRPVFAASSGAEFHPRTQGAR